MGPPPFGSGNSWHAGDPGANGTALQWGHRLSAVETIPMYDDAVGVITLQWGHRLSAVETASIASVSCAAIMLQWGHRLSAVETWGVRTPGGAGYHASMGPPPFGSGNLRQGQLPPLAGVASMGPPPFGSGNHCRKSAWTTPSRASMGPPPFGSGNVYLCPDSDFNPWDRATSAAMTSGTRRRFIST